MKHGVNEEQIARAVQFLRAGELVAFPTETVYGLGADASNPEALARLYAAKGRPTSHPVIVHLPDAALVSEWAVDVPLELELLAANFWPGPMTVVLKKADHVLDQVTGGQETVAIRVPAHSIAHALLLEFKGGLAAPSANKFGRLSPTKAQDVASEFADEVKMVLDGGPCQVGIESTILDLSTGAPRILRPGMLLATDLERILGRSIEAAVHDDSVRVPGALPAHYAPTTKVILASSAEFAAVLSKLLSNGEQPAVVSFKDRLEHSSNLPWHKCSDDPAKYAQELYQTLRTIDALQRTCILVERPPDSAPWSGILDRLQRAAAAAPSELSAL